MERGSLFKKISVPYNECSPRDLFQSMMEDQLSPSL